MTLSDVLSRELAPFDMPGILRAQDWRTERTYFRGSRPVIGRHSRDNPMKWPASRADLTTAYPTDGSVDVRLMGGVRSALDVLGKQAPPPAWLALPTDAMNVRTFLNSLDFFVYFQHPNAYEAFGRSVLEALAAGCVAILPIEMSATFGDAALYCDVREVPAVVAALYASPEMFQGQAELAMTRVAEHFSHERYASLVTGLLSRDSLLSA